MQKINQIIFLGFVFIQSVLAFAEEALTPDKQKTAFIENLAKPLAKDKTFYRWQNEESMNSLLSAGELTPELHARFMSIEGDPERQRMGKGVYIADNPYSSLNYGDTLIEVKIAKGHKFLDITNPDIMNQLKEQGITVQNLRELPSSVIISYDNNFMVIKGREGVTFKPFSIQGWTLDQIITKLPLGLRRPFFEQAIGKDIAKLFNDKPPPIDFYFDPRVQGLLEIVETEKGKKYVQNIVKSLINEDKIPIESVNEGAKFLNNVGEYLSDQETQKIIQKAKNLPIESVDEGIALLKLAINHLPEQEIKTITDKIHNNKGGWDSIKQKLSNAEYAVIRPYCLQAKLNKKN